MNLEIVRKLHRWIALTLGGFLVLICLSGSLLYLQPQFFTWIHGDMLPDDLNQTIGSIDRWVTEASVAVPGLEGPMAIWPPHVHHNISDAGMVLFRGANPGRFADTGWVGVLVEPGSGKVLGSVALDQSPAFAPLFFHLNMWGGGVGELLVGVVAVSTIVLLLLGLYLWIKSIRSRGRLRRKLFPASPRTLKNSRALHEWLGIWSLPILLIVAFTGVYMSQPGWLQPVLGAVSGPTEDSRQRFSQLPCGDAIGFDTAIARAQQLVPAAKVGAIEPTYNWRELKPWRISLQTSDSTALHRQVHVYADLECGVVTLDSTPASRARRDAIDLWLEGLHDGQAFGRGGQVFVTLMGFLPLVFLWTGITMWLRRRLAHQNVKRA